MEKIMQWTADAEAAIKKGYRVQLGGKLGRHPRLARELKGIFSEEEVLEIVGACVDFYKQTAQKGARFADILTDDAFKGFAKKFGK
jgi:dissimilatory sulfite reductase (desulfoviridin) alpha/beta subunit